MARVDMGHRGHSELRGRASRQDAFGREAQDRTLIAQTAARLIAEHGIADWSLAKRKAARQLLLSERAALPGDDEVEAALVDYHALFGGDTHVAQLRTQREEALRWMQNLRAFEPALVGGVAAGWATAHSDIRIDLIADNAKAVELALLNAGVAYRSMAATDDGHPSFYVDTRAGGVRLSVRTAEAARQLPRRGRHGTDVLRLSAADLTALLAASP
jgi:hypothetical protein